MRLLLQTLRTVLSVRRGAVHGRPARGAAAETRAPRRAASRRVLVRAGGQVSASSSSSHGLTCETSLLYCCSLSKEIGVTICGIFGWDDDAAAYDDPDDDDRDDDDDDE